MTKDSAIKIFETQKVRTQWDEREEKWYFSIVDVIGVLTDSYCIMSFRVLTFSPLLTFTK